MKMVSFLLFLLWKLSSTSINADAARSSRVQIIRHDAIELNGISRVFSLHLMQVMSHQNRGFTSAFLLFNVVLEFFLC